MGGFGQLYYGRLAVPQGFDAALLTDPAGTVSETGTAGIDGLRLPVDDRLMRTVTDRYHAVAWELI